MRKLAFIFTFLMAMILSGCGSGSDNQVQKADSEAEISGTQAENVYGVKMPEMSAESESEIEVVKTSAENTSETDSEKMQNENFENTEVVQGGPYGELMVTLPDGWDYETCPVDSDSIWYGMYGIHFYPEGVSEGYIELAYVGQFGVCGTGLESEKITVAGDSANMGTYDHHEYWDFISFGEKHEGVVAQTYMVEDWWGEYGDQVIEILDTLSFRPDVKEGGAYLYSEESQIEKIGIYFSLQKISSTGATIAFSQHYENAPSGELIYGDDFVIERKENGKWESVPVVVEGEYGFHDIAYNIAPGEVTEKEMSWEWLYGTLSPGEYRMGKSVLNVRGSGDFDKYMVYAHFILN